VSVAHERRVIAPGERAVERRANALIGLRAHDDESADTEARQHGLECGLLERVAIALLYQRLGVVRRQLGDDLPLLASSHEVVVAVLDPDDRDLLGPRLLDEAADVRDDCVAFGRPLDDAGLHVDDEECGVRPVLECGHGSPCSRGTVCPPNRS